MLCGCFWRYLCRKVCSPIAYFAFFSKKWPLTLRLLHPLLCFSHSFRFCTFFFLYGSFFLRFSSSRCIFVEISLTLLWTSQFVHRISWFSCDFMVLLCGGAAGQWSHLPAGRLNIACRLLSWKLSEMPKITLDKSWIMVYYNNAVIRNA